MEQGLSTGLLCHRRLGESGGAVALVATARAAVATAASETVRTAPSRLTSWLARSRSTGRDMVLPQSGQRRCSTSRAPPPPWMPSKARLSQARLHLKASCAEYSSGKYSGADRLPQFGTPRTSRDSLQVSGLTPLLSKTLACPRLTVCIEQSASHSPQKKFTVPQTSHRLKSATSGSIFSTSLSYSRNKHSIQSLVSSACFKCSRTKDLCVAL